MNETRRKILIVGGGSAGWMTAALLAKTLGRDHQIELVESSQIGTVGVGEGSTPKIRALFDALGIPEAQWMPACSATYKNGIRFSGWSDRPGFENFFHGFYSHFDRDHLKALRFNSVLRRARFDVHAHPDIFLYNSYLAQRRLSPTTPDHFPFDVQYAYHFDAALLGDFLKSWAIARGVTCRDARVKQCERSASGDLAAVVTDKGIRIAADIFIDCTGFAASLIEREMGARYLSYSESLANDAAVALRTDPDDNPHPMTEATTMRFGWAWRIPLQSRTGNGYVYASRYCDAAKAEAELRATLPGGAKGVEALHLKMRIGRLERPWIGNCIGVGLAQGFLEPLEATGLALTQYTITRFAHHLLEHGCTDGARERFNAEIGDAFDGVRDFIVMHYLTASRDDTQYWRDVRSNRLAMSDNLGAVLDAWFSGKDFDQVLQQRRMTEYFSLHSWYYVMCGKGIFPQQCDRQPSADMLAKVPLEYFTDFLTRCTLNHESHADRLASLAEGHIDRQPEPDGDEALELLLSAVPNRDRVTRQADFR